MGVSTVKMSQTHDSLPVKRATFVNDVPRLSTGCSKMDDLLHGGLPSMGIVEIFGESGTGKSQLCMQIALTAQYPESRGGLNGGVVYICTEEHFQSKRLKQLIQHFPKQYYKDRTSDIDFGNNIFIEHTADFETLVNCLSRRIPVLTKRRNIKLVIVDSIAGACRGSYSIAEGYQKANDLRTIGSILQTLCDEHCIMVVCVNQVSDVVSSNNSKESQSVAALGLAWANLVSTRLQLSRFSDSRKIKVVFSPELPSDFERFSIRDCGIVDDS